MSLLTLVNQLRDATKGVEGLPDTVATVLDSLQEQAGTFEGLDPNAARTAMSELEQLRPQVADLQAKAQRAEELQTTVADLTDQGHAAKRLLIASRTINSAGIRPEFHDLLEPTIASAAELNPSTGAFELPENYVDGLKSKYPTAFLAEDGAGTGGAANDGAQPEPPTSDYQIPGDRTITGVNPADVLEGRVQFAT